MAGAASILGDQRLGWPGSVPCSQDPRQGPHPLCITQRSCANDPQPLLDLKGGPPPSPSVWLGLAGMSPCARPSSQRSPGSGQAQGGGAPLTQVARWGASRIRNTWLGQPHVPVSLHPALGQLTHRAEPGREQGPGSTRPSHLHPPVRTGHTMWSQPLHHPARWVCFLCFEAPARSPGLID